VIRLRIFQINLNLESYSYLDPTPAQQSHKVSATGIMSSRRRQQKGREYNPNIKVAGRRPMMHPTRGETTKYGTDCGQPDMEQRRRAHQELGNEENDGMSFANRASLGSDGDVGSSRARRGHSGETLGGRVRDGSDGDMGDRDGEPRSGEEGRGEIQVGGIEHHRSGGGDGGEGEMGLERGGRGQGRGGCVLGGGAQEHGGDPAIESPGGRASSPGLVGLRLWIPAGYGRWPRSFLRSGTATTPP